jgi:glycosyltransferase involved in cell wall biosynthesis
LSAAHPASEPARLNADGDSLPPEPPASPLRGTVASPWIAANAGRDASFCSVPLKLSILMPAYNEEDTIARAADEILNADYPCDIELIVVDDGSTDRTLTFLGQVQDSRMVVHRHVRNMGKGAALLSAASLATGTHILPFDADLEYSPDDIPKMLEPVLKGRCEVIYGTRLFGCNTVYQSYRYAVGNRVLTRMTNLLFNAFLNDLHTCLKLIPLKMLRSLNLSEKGFGLDTELTALLLRRGIRPFEVPVSYYGRSHAQGKKINWRDAVMCAWILLRVRLWGRSESISADETQDLGGPAEVVIASSASRGPGQVTALVDHGDGDEIIPVTMS